MSETLEFIHTLFEKSKVLNNLNTEFLKELQTEGLPLNQKINLFYQSTLYHENILKSISDIVKNTDKTSLLLDVDTREVVNIYDTLDEFSRNKVFKIIQAVKNTQFIPENLSTCPLCGNILSSKNDVKCKKIPLRIGSLNCGYTYKCGYNGE